MYGVGMALDGGRYVGEGRGWKKELGKKYAREGVWKESEMEGSWGG